MKKQSISIFVAVLALLVVALPNVEQSLPLTRSLLRERSIS